MTAPFSYRTLLVVAAVTVTLVGVAFWQVVMRTIPEQDPRAGADRPEVVVAAEAFYEEHPVYMRPHPYTAVPKGLPDMSAETCGACHVEIYEEWKLSTHRRAWTDDAQFQAELEKSRGHGEPGAYDVSWMCVNCHTPLVNQLPQLVIGLEDGDLGRPIYADNPSFDAKLQHEAITCATCHVRDGVVLGPFGDTSAPHPTRKSDTLTSAELCTRCHNAQAVFPKQNLGCFFATGDEWAASSYAERGEACQSCHMPEVERPLVAGMPPRKTRRHWFGGSLIPKKPEYEDEIAPLREIYGDAVDLSLEVAGDDVRFAEHPVPAAEGEARKAPQAVTRCQDEGPCTRLAVRVTNAHAGHSFPTGDPERHADIVATARTPEGDLLATSSLRIASSYRWWPEIKLEWDNRIAAGASRTFLLEVPYEGPFEVELHAEKFRMYEAAFEHHELEGEYVRGRPFHHSRWQWDAAALRRVE